MKKKNRKNRRSKKKRITRLLAVVLACAVLISSVIFVNSKKLVIEFYENAEVNVNETADNYQFIKNLENGEILTGKTEIDTSSVGEKKISLTVKPTFGAEKVFTYSVTVIDRESPKITFDGALETTEGTEIDLLKGVSATDNSNEEFALSVAGDYDFTNPGEYSLKYVAIDSSNNKTEEEFTLTVKAREIPTTPQVQETPSKPSSSSSSSSSSASTSETVTFTTSKGYQGITKNGVTYIDGYLVANKTYSLPSSYGNGLTA